MKYWEKDIYSPNGIDRYGMNDMISKVNLLLLEIKSGYHILDLWCWNGLLLKILWQHTQWDIIPYGIDTIEESILQAKNIIHPQFQDNFIHGYMMDFPFENYNKFDLIIFDPGMLLDKEILIFFQKLKRNTNKICILMYTDPVSIRRFRTGEKLEKFLFWENWFTWKRKGGMLYTFC